MFVTQIFLHLTKHNTIIMYPCLLLILSSIISTSSSGRVEHLPGFDGPLPFHLETGYIGVDENDNVQLFYYFIQSESNPKDDPLMLWITGGPGCSSISGILYEIGPIKFEDNQVDGSLPSLTLRSQSWTKMASIIFLDIPVGTGFSYATTPNASHSTDIQLSHQAYHFMRKWLEGHSGFISNPYYIGGDSYSGYVVPIIAQLISNGNEATTLPYINLKGYVLGNPSTFIDQVNYGIPFANGMGLISDELYTSLLDSCHGEYRSDYINPSNVRCLHNLEWYQECIDGIELSHILEPHCGNLVSPIKLPSHHRLSAYYCRIDGYKLAYYWVNDASVRQALYIHKENVDDVRPYHLNLSNKGYRSLIYSGDHDMIVPHQSTEAWVKELNYSVMDRWRPWKLHGQIAGYTESYSNMMTYATIKGGGHTAPAYKPQECFVMFKRWISHQPL